MPFNQSTHFCPPRRLTIFDLPNEILNEIFGYVFATHDSSAGFSICKVSGGQLLDENYSAQRALAGLLASKQLHTVANLFAFSRTRFVVTNRFFDIPQRLSVLSTRQLDAIRSIAFVADQGQFRKIRSWDGFPFGLSALRLENLTIVLHRSSFWHYLFDFTTDIARLLRNLRGVQNLIFVRNGARVKGSFKTWYNRLVGLMMKIDHAERYLGKEPCLGVSWWRWALSESAQSFSLRQLEPHALVAEETYMKQMAPLLEDLRRSIESEEVNLDPRSWNGT